MAVKGWWDMRSVHYLILLIQPVSRPGYDDCQTGPPCIPVADIQQDRAVVARWAHNPKVVGSIPTPATNDQIIIEVVRCQTKRT